MRRLCVQRVRQFAQAFTHRLVAQNDQPVGRRIGNHLAARPFSFFAQRLLHDLGHITGLRMAQLDHRIVMPRAAIQLANQLGNTPGIGGGVSNDQRIGRRRRPDIPVGRYQGPQQPRHVSRDAGIKFDDLGDKGLIGAIRVARAGFGLSGGNDQ